MSKKLIEPVYRKCKCGRRIIHHHILCDCCWKRKQRMKINKFQNIIEEGIEENEKEINEKTD